MTLLARKNSSERDRATHNSSQSGQEDTISYSLTKNDNGQDHTMDTEVWNKIHTSSTSTPLILGLDRNSSQQDVKVEATSTTHHLHTTTAYSSSFLGRPKPMERLPCTRRRDTSRERALPSFESTSRQCLNIDTSYNCSHPHPYVRVALLVLLLLFPALAIAYAIASGLESMYAAKQQLRQKHPPLEYHSNGVGKSDANRSAYAYIEANTPEDEGATASVLSRASQLSELISHLDASDVVECYVVTRMAPLANLAVFGVGSAVGGTDSGKDRAMLDRSTNATVSNVGDNTPASAPIATPSVPSGPIVIRKSALAFRYRPRVASASHRQSLSRDQSRHEKYFELTLEYGPQRAGAAKTSESIPIVRMDTDSFSMNSNIGKYVSWENEGRVYHSTQISKEWTDAYYMAPISGVVFEKIIQRAVDYSSTRPRYQPFEVVSIPSGNLILRSSDSDDFVWDMFHALAELYVVIDPLLVPPRDKVQFYVADPDRTSGDDSDGNGASGRNSYVRNDGKQVNPNVLKVKGPIDGLRAAVFYENFFHCVNAIKTGDYSLYIPPPSVAPSLSPTVSLAPSVAASVVYDKYSINNDVVQNEYNVDSGAKDYEQSDEYIDGMHNTLELENNEGRLLTDKFLRHQRLLDETNNDAIDKDAESNIGIIEDGNDNFLSSIGDSESLVDSFESIHNVDDSAESYNEAAKSYNEAAEAAAADDATSNNAGTSNPLR